MEKITEVISLTSPSLAKNTFDRIAALRDKTPDERFKIQVEIEQRKVDRFNASIGHLNKLDGYNCEACRNRGSTAVLDVVGGCIYPRYPECKCMGIRRSIQRMKASGLETIIRDNTFKTFKADAPWQKAMVDKATAYLDEGISKGAWLFFGGQVGSGKTHICTAVAGKLLYTYPVIYVVWPQVSKKLKAMVNDAEDYAAEIGRLQDIEVLYVDDLFKPVKDDFGRTVPPTAADMRLAFELFNYRYINKLPTIISSEWTVAELVDMDEATGSRIAERTRGYCMTVARDKERNHRLGGEESV